MDTRLWDAVLRARRPAAPVWGVAVDDCHTPKQFNRGWISVKVAEISTGALRQALMRGAFYASTGPSADFSVAGQSVVVRLEERGRIQFVDGRGIMRSEVNGAEGQYEVHGDERFVRVEVSSSAGLAWSQPFWLNSPR
jgi:hypothetical protein